MISFLATLLTRKTRDDGSFCYRHSSTPALPEEMRQNGYSVHSSGGRVQSGPVHFQILGYNNSPIPSLERCDEAMLVLLQQALCAQAQKTDGQPAGCRAGVQFHDH